MSDFSWVQGDLASALDHLAAITPGSAPTPASTPAPTPAPLVKQANPSGQAGSGSQSGSGSQADSGSALRQHVLSLLLTGGLGSLYGLGRGLAQGRSRRRIVADTLTGGLLGGGLGLAGSVAYNALSGAPAAKAAPTPGQQARNKVIDAEQKVERLIRQQGSKTREADPKAKMVDQLYDKIHAKLENEVAAYDQKHGSGAFQKMSPEGQRQFRYNVALKVWEAEKATKGPTWGQGFEQIQQGLGQLFSNPDDESTSGKIRDGLNILDPVGLKYSVPGSDHYSPRASIAGLALGGAYYAATERANRAAAFQHGLQKGDWARTLEANKPVVTALEQLRGHPGKGSGELRALTGRPFGGISLKGVPAPTPAAPGAPPAAMATYLDRPTVNTVINSVKKPYTPPAYRRGVGRAGTIALLAGLPGALEQWTGAGSYGTSTSPTTQTGLEALLNLTDDDFKYVGSTP